MKVRDYKVRKNVQMTQQAQFSEVIEAMLRTNSEQNVVLETMQSRSPNTQPHHPISFNYVNDPP